MLAAVYQGIEDMEVKEVPTPRPGPGEVLVRILATALCGTDVRIYYHGHRNVTPPQIIGHEIAGIVEETGSDVEGYEVGDPVTVVTSIGCGSCRFCRVGMQNLCPKTKAIGYHYPGGFAEYIAIPKEAVSHGNLIKLPKGISFDDASLIEPLSCCINGQEYLNIGIGDTVCIIGAGPIGLMHAELASVQGASKTIIVDIVEEKEEIIKEFAVDHFINASKEDPVQRVMELTDGEGADVVIVAASSVQAQVQAIQMAATKGRVSFFAGLPREASTMALDSNKIHYKEVSIYGAFASHGAQYEKAMKLIASGRIKASKWITHILPLENIVEAIKMKAKGVGLKHVFHPYI
jgi:L-iditol 2-dehydrogenase